MKKEDLLYKLTGTEAPKFINERENVIINKCLNLINDLECEVKNLDISFVSQRSELLKAFMRWQESQDISQFDDQSETIERYLESH